jgi:lysophospholipase L1-like esterase
MIRLLCRAREKVDITRRRHPFVALLTSALVVAGIVVPAAPADAATKWTASWTAAQQAATPAPLALAPNDFSSSGFTNQTIRNVIWTSVGGQGARIRLSNQYGTQPVTFNRVYLGRVAGGAALVTGSSRAVTFGGQAAVTIAPGATALSDTVTGSISPATKYAISLFSQNATGPATYNWNTSEVNYVAAGNAAANETSGPFTTITTAWYFAAELDVLADTQVGGTIVAFGDSLTAGLGSSVGADLRYTNNLARRFLSLPTSQQRAVVGEGISGNRVLNNSACLGDSALARFTRDISVADARWVIFLEGINDIGFSQLPNVGCFTPNTDVSAAQIIAGYQQIINLAHARNLKIFGGTLTPFQGASFYTEAGEAKRVAVNNWIRTSGAFDAVIDFDAVLRDTVNPKQLMGGYDSGDHIHPNDAGYQAMSNAVPLSLFN